MVMYVIQDNRRCRVCGRRMLMWRWRWAHRRCVRASAHPWQEYNAYGNTCHYPDCRLTEEEHAQSMDSEIWMTTENIRRAK